MLHNENIDIKWVLKNRTIQTHFQPIVSIQKQAIIGLEALSRGVDPNHDIIMPQSLFAAAANEGESVALDRLCREKALENYKNLARQGGTDKLLFINLNTAILDEGVVGSGHLINAVHQAGLPPSSIVIEVIESKVKDIESLTKFINLYKQYGFLIALDDMGSDSSNLDRILQVHPDIIKIDRGLIMSINNDYYKQELFKALVFVAKKTGSVVIAEGVETHNEAVTCLELGADFLQGYHIGYPTPFPTLRNSGIAKTMHLLSLSYRSSMIEKIRNAALTKNFYENILEGLIEELATVSPDNLETKLKELANKQTCVQCYYILDISGTQITETIKPRLSDTEKHGAMFHPACQGTDQSLKDYYLYIHAGFERYISEPYISHANGLPCITGSIFFRSNDGASHILCIDFYL